MSDTIPVSWEQPTLGEVCDIAMGQSPPSTSYNTEGIGLPFFQGKTEFGYVFPQVKKWCDDPKKFAHMDDILLSVRAPVGPTNIAIETCCIGRGLAAIRPMNGLADRFIFYLLRQQEPKIAAMGTGTTFKAISGKQVRDIDTPLPPLPEQHRIVAKIEELFSRLDAGIDSLKTAQAQLKQYRQSVLKTAVEGKLTAKWREEHQDEIEPAEVLLARIMKERRAKWETDQLAKYTAKGKTPPEGWLDKYKEPAKPDTADLPDLPEGWVWASVEQVADDVTYGSSKKTSEDASGVPVLRMGNIFEGQLSLNKLKYLPVDHEEFPALLLEPHDMLFNRTNSAKLVGKTTVYQGTPNPCSFASYLIRVRFAAQVSSDFISYFINSIYGRTWIKGQISQQVGQANVNGTKLKNLAIPFPPSVEQQRLIENVNRLLESADRAEAMIIAELDRASALRQSILKQAFEGQLVPQNHNDEPASVLLERIKAEKAKVGKKVKQKERV